MPPRPPYVCITLAALAAVFTPSLCCQASGTPNAAAAAAPAPRPTTLDAVRQRLLELAFDVASSLPADPHHKTRARTQEQVVVACLGLDRPELAERWAERIQNWRRGACLADIAFYHARRGETRGVHELLQRATAVADEGMSAPDAQAWRRDRVRAKIARTFVQLGETAKAAEFVDGAVPQESARLETAKASVLDANAFDAQLDAVDGLLAQGDLEQKVSALETCVQLFDRFFADETRRSAVEERIRTTSERMPILLRVDLLLRLASSALDHDDSGRGSELLGAAAEAMQAAHWLPEHEIPLRCRLAELRFRCGDAEAARHGVEVALRMYEGARDDTETARRAGILRPVAEAFAAVGRPEQALATYRRVVEDGAENPNARPRACDLSATCVSMAVRGIAPDDALWDRMRAIRAGLRHPW